MRTSQRELQAWCLRKGSAMAIVFAGRDNELEYYYVTLDVYIVKLEDICHHKADDVVLRHGWYSYSLVTSKLNIGVGPICSGASLAAGQISVHEVLAHVTTSLQRVAWIQVTVLQQKRRYAINIILGIEYKTIIGAEIRHENFPILFFPFTVLNSIGAPSLRR